MPSPLLTFDWMDMPNKRSFSLELELVKRLYDQAIPTFFYAVLSVTTYLTVLADTIPYWQQWTFGCTAIGWNFYRVILYRRFIKQPIHTEQDLRKWSSLFNLGLKVSSGIWAVATLLFCPSGSIPEITAYLLIFAATTSAGTMALATSISNVIWHISLISTALAIQLSIRIYQENPGSMILFIILILIYLVAIIAAAARYRSSVIEQITLRLENEKLVNRLRGEKQQAESENRAKSVFLATMSHEIRTPLNGLLGMIQVMREEPLDASQNNHLETMYNSAMMLLKVLNDVLDYSKIEVGKLELEHSRFNWVQLVNEVFQLMKPNADAKGIDFDIKTTNEGSECLMGDPFRLKQILTNLLSNSIKFTEAGSVRLEFHCFPPENNRCKLQIDVYDTGSGIPKKAYSKLFSRFTQADVSINRKHGGTGLGLAISQKLAHLMGTEIGFNSEVNVGSHFYLSPVFDLTPEPSDCTGKINGAHFENRIRNQRVFDGKALIVDDDAVCRKVGFHLLKKIGFECEVVEDGESALQKIKSDSWDIVFMDYRMPNMDGPETTRRIRSYCKGSSNQPYLIACTANTSLDDRLRCLEAGMDDFMTKPIMMTELQEILDRWTANRRSNPTGFTAT